MQFLTGGKDRFQNGVHSRGAAALGGLPLGEARAAGLPLWEGCRFGGEARAAGPAAFGGRRTGTRTESY